MSETKNITDEVEPVEAAEPLSRLQRASDKAYQAAHDAERDPQEVHSGATVQERRDMAADLDELRLDEFWATNESGVRQPGETAEQFRDGAEQETAAETDPGADPDDAESEAEKADPEPDIGVLCSPESGLSGAESRPLREWDLLPPYLRRETETDLVPIQPGTADFAFAHGWSPDGGRHGLFALGKGLIIDGPEREPGA